MRAWISMGLGVLLLASCRPSATVQRTTPVANLQPYTGLIVRGTRAGRHGMGRLAFMLERASVARIRRACSFRGVHPAARSAEPGPDDLLLDVTVQNAYRGGGGGLVQNENQATVVVKAVLSDGADMELVGAADIRGQSGGLIIGEQSPEQEAINAVADSIVQMLVRSGCRGPRIARAHRPPPVDHRTEQPDEQSSDPTGVALVSDEKSEAAVRAETENEEGKRLFRAADVAGAKGHFRTAIRLHRDPRYVFNLCLAEEALGSIDAAISTCRRVASMKPDAALAEKVKLRLKILGDKQQQP
ncbi:MAG TPA: hypothetical protein VK698_00280 [Kofleriaceae bacterium]|nr:hypothetical protein [Kofleriaceae bacterium]